MIPNETCLFYVSLALCFFKRINKTENDILNLDERGKHVSLAKSKKKDSSCRNIDMFAKK